MGQSANAQADSLNSGGSSTPGHSRDVRELVGLVDSSKKIVANRSNAKKSTGPRTLRGKSRARWNALKHGAFATLRPIRGEDAKAYRDLSERVLTETTPKTAIECMLVDQIIGDMWRLKRVEQAERAYFEQIRKAALSRAVRLLSAEEIQLVPDILERAKPTVLEGAGTMSRSVNKKLEVAINPDKLMLDGMVSPELAFPYFTLAQIRRSLVQGILRKDARLAEQQG
jgi:hypothetical protein